MKVKDCMTKDVVSVRETATLADVITTFRKASFHTLPVVDNNNNILGIVSFEDLLKVFQPYAIEIGDMLKTIPFAGEAAEDEDILVTDISEDLGLLVVAAEIMGTDFVTIEEGADVMEAKQLMKLHSQPRLPVTKKGKLLGIISLFDIVLAIFREKGIIKNGNT